jgi:hypothetical protein
LRKAVVSSGLAGVALVAAVALRWLLDPLMGNEFPLVTLAGAIAARSGLRAYVPP